MPLLSLGFLFQPRGADQFTGKTRQVDREARRASQGVDRLDGSLKRSGNSAVSAARQLGGFVTAFGAIRAARGGVRILTEFEDGLVAVGKTTDITGGQLQALGDDILALSRGPVPIARDSLLEIAAAAGQLGVEGEEGILAFTETLARLERSTDLAGESGAQSLARILNVTGEAATDVDVLGSVLVRLGNNFAATESEITQAATRIASATGFLGASSADAAALATAFTATGTLAEVAGSTTQRAFDALGSAARSGGAELALLAETTGLQEQAFRDLFANDPARAFESFVIGLGGVIDRGGDATAVLNRLGLQGVRVEPTLLKLADNSELLSDALNQAADEVENTDALVRESEASFSTLTSRYQALQNTAASAFLELRGGGEVLGDLIDGTREGIAALAGLDGGFDNVSDSGRRFAVVISILGGASGLPLLLQGIRGVVGGLRLLTVAIAGTGIGAIAVVLGAAAGAAFAFRDELVTLGDTTASVGDFILGAFDALRERISFLAERVLPLLTTGFSIVEGTVVDVFGAISDIVSSVFIQLGVEPAQAFDSIIQGSRVVGNAVIGTFVAIGNVIGDVFELIIDNFAELGRLDFSDPVSFFQSLGDVSLSQIERSFEAVGNLGGSVGEAFQEDYIGAIGDLGTNAANLLLDGFQGQEGEQAASAFFGGFFEDAAASAAERAAARVRQTAENELGGGPAGGVGAAPGAPDAGFALPGQISATLPLIQALTAARAAEAEAIGLQNDALDEEISRLEEEEARRSAVLDAGGDELRALEAIAIANGNEELSERIRLLDEERDRNDALEESAARFAEFSGNVSSAITDSIRTVSKEGFDDIEGLARNTLQRILDAYLEAFVFQQIASAINTGVGGLGSLLGFAGAAKRGAIYGGGQVEFFQRGGILDGFISAPTVFPTGRGIGVAGEAGDELGLSTETGAIAPLRRGPNGLGIEIVGGSAGGNTSQTIQINNPSGMGDINRSLAQIRRQGRRTIATPR